jgi:hypothetical protein
MCRSSLPNGSTEIIASREPRTPNPWTAKVYLLPSVKVRVPLPQVTPPPLGGNYCVQERQPSRQRWRVISVPHDPSE